MANSIYIDVSALLKAAQQLKGMEKELAENVDIVLWENAKEIAKTAKKITAKNKDMGGLGASINPLNLEPLKKSVTVNAFYAPFVEFGTGKYAAQHVGSLPADWQQLALKFKGQNGGGNISEFFENMVAWVKRKQIRFEDKDVFKTGKKKGQKKKLDYETTAYIIVHYILINGIHAHPFLFPAYEQQRPQIAKDIAAVINALIAMKT